MIRATFSKRRVMSYCSVMLRVGYCRHMKFSSMYAVLKSSLWRMPNTRRLSSLLVNVSSCKRMFFHEAAIPQ
jgi:hypothetical protein